MRPRILAFAAAAFLASAGAAYAQFTGAEIVKAWDKNGDGVVTKDEWVAAGRPAERFDLVDANHDGKLTAEELDAALARLRAAHGQDAPGQPAPPAAATPPAAAPAPPQGPSPAAPAQPAPPR